MQGGHPTLAESLALGKAGIFVGARIDILPLEAVRRDEQKSRQGLGDAAETLLRLTQRNLGPRRRRHVEESKHGTADKIIDAAIRQDAGQIARGRTLVDDLAF